MFAKRKTFIIFSLVFLFVIILGFGALYIRVKTLPDIACHQEETQNGYENEDMYITMPIDKGWEDNGYHASQYNATLYNNTAHTLTDWSVVLTLPQDSKITDSWNIVIEENQDGTVTISNNVDQGFNDNIFAHDKIDFGFILYSHTVYEINDFDLKATPHARMRDYNVFYALVLCVFLLILYVTVNIALIIKEHQYKIRAALDQKIILQSMKTFTNFIDAKDKYTRGHSIRVAFYTKKLAEKMGFDDEELYRIYYIALLHDVGKINIPDAILNKPGALTKEEMDVIKTHTTNGALILKDFSSLPNIIEGAKYHHERYDGKGYPEGIKGEDIPLVARIIGVADAFDAMNSDRCYRKAFPIEKIVAELEEGSGKQFDPEIVKVMLELIKNDAFKNMNDELKDN